MSINNLAVIGSSIYNKDFSIKVAGGKERNLSNIQSGKEDLAPLTKGNFLVGIENFVEGKDHKTGTAIQYPKHNYAIMVAPEQSDIKNLNSLFEITPAGLFALASTSPSKEPADKVKSMISGISTVGSTDISKKLQSAEKDFKTTTRKYLDANMSTEDAEINANRELNKSYL